MAQFRYIVDDLDSALKFYTTALGFKLDKQFGPAMAIIHKDDLTLWLAGPMSSAAKVMPNGDQPRPGGWSRIVLSVENIQETVSKLREAGVFFRGEIVEGPGGKQVLCEDPSGNAIELFEGR